MNAVDLWLVVALILFVAAAIAAWPRTAGRYGSYAMALVAGGLACFVIAALVERN